MTDTLPVAEQRLVGRITGGHVADLTVAQVKTLLAYVPTDIAAQPVDSDLTAIAALTTTAYGRAVLALADAAALRTAAGVVIGTDVEAHDADLTTIAGLSPTNDDVLQRKAGAWANRTIAQLATDLGLAASYQPLDSDLTAIAALTTTATGRSLLAAADAAALRTILGLGTAATQATGAFDASGAAAAAQAASQPLDADLTALAGLTSAADKLPYFTGSGAAAVTTLSSFIRTLIDDADATTARTTLGLAAGATLGATQIVRFVVDGGGSTITTGAKKAYVTVPWAATITSWNVLADQSGSIVFDIWKDTYANYPPTVADTITASAKPTLSTATKATGSTLTGWTTSITAGDVLEINVDSITTCTKVVLEILVTRTS